MKNLIFAILLLAGSAGSALAQTQPLAQPTRFAITSPSGSCGKGEGNVYDTVAGVEYGCKDADNDGTGVWTAVSGTSSATLNYYGVFSGRPAASSLTDGLVVITDCTTPACAAGSGSIKVMQVDVGSTWEFSGVVNAAANVQSILSAADYAAIRTLLALVVGTNVQAYDADLTTFAGITPSANVQSVLGAADYAAIRTLLALVIGTNVQAYDADLTTFAGITPSANVQSVLSAADYAAIRTLLGLVIGTNVQAYDADLATFAGITPTANVQSVLSAADYAAIRTLLGLVIGTNVQAYDADLAALAALSCADGEIPKKVSGVWACGTDGGGGATISPADIMSGLRCPSTAASTLAYGCVTTNTSTLANGHVVLLVLDATNTGNATLSVNSSSAKAILHKDLTQFAAGDLVSGDTILLYYDGTQFIPLIEILSNNPAQLTFRCGTAPATPATDKVVEYCNSDVMHWKNDLDTVYTLVVGDSGASNNFLTAIDPVTGVITKTQPTEANLSTSDITTNNCSTSKHGFTPKGSGTSTEFLNGNCTWATPAGGGSTNQFTTSAGGVALFSDIVTTNSYNGLATNNIVLYIEYVPKVTADLKIFKINTGGALAPNVAVGFMDSTCSTLLATSDTQTFIPGGYLTLTFPTAVSVVAGTPYFFMISTYNSGGDAQFAWDLSGAAIPTIMNTFSPKRMFTDDSRSTGTGTLTLPSACSGTRVAANIGMPVWWAAR